MDDNIRRVLQLVQEGKLTAQEAEMLISALSPKPASASATAPSAVTTPPRPAEAPMPPRAPEAPAVPQPPVMAAPPRAPEAPQAPEPPKTPEAPLPAPEPPRPAPADPAAARLATGDLLLQIADDPSIPENEKLNLIVHATALICTVLALQPIPGVDVFILTPILVASVLAMSQVMGIPIGRNGAGEIVASVVGVVGLGLLAEQFVLAGAKLLLPLFGGFTLIPLIYAATYGICWAARAVLDARRSDRQISDAEIRRIKEEAERRAKAEKRDWSLAAIKAELDTWRTRAEAFKRFEDDYNRLYSHQAALREEIERLSLEVADLAQRKMALQSRLAAPAGQGEAEVDRERLRVELAEVDRAWQAQGEALDHKDKELNGVMWRLEALTNARFTACYPGVGLDVDVIDALALLPGPRLNALERQVALLQFDPARADYRGDGFLDAAGHPVRVIEFDADGRLYVEAQPHQALIRAVGNRRTEDKDIARLKRED